MDPNTDIGSNCMSGFHGVVPFYSHSEHAISAAAFNFAEQYEPAIQDQEVPDPGHLDGARLISSVTLQSHEMPQGSMPLEQSHEANGPHENSRQFIPFPGGVLDQPYKPRCVGRIAPGYGIKGQVTYKSGPREEEWEHYKPQICRLYQRGGLKKLMEVMKRDHAFNATYGPNCSLSPWICD